MSVKGDEFLDLSGVACPANFTRALIRLSGMDEGKTLEIIIDDGEPYRNVPSAIEEEGHAIILLERAGERWRLVVRKNG